MPQVSVITPYRNAARFLPELLDPLTRGDRRFRRLALPAPAGCGSPRRLPGIPRKLEQQLTFHRERGLDLSVTAYGRFQRAEAPLRALRRPPAQLALTELRRHNPLPLLTVGWP